MDYENIFTKEQYQLVKAIAEYAIKCHEEYHWWRRALSGAAYMFAGALASVIIMVLKFKNLI